MNISGFVVILWFNVQRQNVALREQGIQNIKKQDSTISINLRGEK